MAYNKKGQNQDWIGLIIAIPIILIIGALFVQTIASISCQNEKSQISNLQNQLNTCNSNLNALNDYVENCSQNIQSVEENCQNRIDNATKECQTRISIFEEIINNYNVYIVIYTLTIVFSFALAVNLFGLSFEFKFGKKIDSFLKKYESFWFWVKIIIWILTIVFILVFLWAFFHIGV